jgi:peptidoglycan/LPS O-acetylase OafA/YrhL
MRVNVPANKREALFTGEGGSNMNRFIALNSWRGICACLVAFMHFDVYSHFHFLTFYGNGYLFVDFFFVLSGFVISANYQKRLMRWFAIGKFMLLRFGRLYPLHLFMLVCFIGFELIHAAISTRYVPSPSAPFTGEEKSLPAIAANILLIHSLHLFDTLTWNRPSWSISTEFYSYFIFALMLIWFRKRGWLVIAIVMVVSPVVIAFVSDHNMETSFDYGIIRCIYGFSAGILAFNIYDLYLREPSAFANRVTTTIAEVTSLAIMLTFVFMSGTKTISVLAPYVFLIVVIAFSLDGGLLSSVMKWRPLVALGTLSYSIYMIHLFVQFRLCDAGQLIETMSGRHLIETWSGVQVLTYVDAEHNKLLATEIWYGDLLHLAMLPIVIAASCLTYRLIEEPSRAWFRSVSQGLFVTKQYRPSLVSDSELSAVRVPDPGQAR